MKAIVLQTRRRASYFYGGSYTVIVPNTGAGSRGRYTVWRLPCAPREGDPALGARVIGRELSLDLARRVAARDERLDGAPLA